MRGKARGCRLTKKAKRSILYKKDLARERNAERDCEPCTKH